MATSVALVSLFQVVVLSAITAPMILVIEPAKSGTGRFKMAADFSAMAGMISFTSSNFSWTFTIFFFFSRCLRRPRPISNMAFRTSSITSLFSARASLASEVNWTFVLARWTRMAAGPFGTPRPPAWSIPYCRQSTDSMAFVSKQPPCWYISGTRFANRSTSTGLSAAIPSPKIRPTSTWYGLPWETVGERVMVVTKRESMVFESPFLMSNSSMGDKQLVGGLSNLTGLSFNKRSPWKASISARIWSGFINFGFAFSKTPAASSSCLAARDETPLKFLYRNEVIRLSVDSVHIRWRVPRWIPWGCGLMLSTFRGRRSVTLGQWWTSPSGSTKVMAAWGFTMLVIRRYW